MGTTYRRHARRAKSLPTWRIVRYTDDFVILVHGDQADVQALRDDVATVLAPLGLRLSPAKTRVVHMSDGFEFLGFHIQWRRKRGTNQWYVYTFIRRSPGQGYGSDVAIGVPSRLRSSMSATIGATALSGSSPRIAVPSMPFA